MRVAVVGGGAIGLCTAYFLRERGADVTLLERGECGAETSRGNAGWITPSLSAPIPAPGVMAQALRWMIRPDSPFFIRPRVSLDLVRWCYAFARNCTRARHEHGMRAMLRFSETTLDLFDRMRDKGVSFEMHSNGLLFLALSNNELEKEQEMFHDLADAGFGGEVEVLDRSAVQEREPAVGEAVVGGVYVASERHVRPESLTRGLVEYLRSHGVTITERAAVTSMRKLKTEWHIGGDAPVVVDAVVIASGANARRMLERLGTKLPLLTAKGYSLTAVLEQHRPRYPLYFVEAKVGCSPFVGGIRLAGTLELAEMTVTLSPRRVAAITRSAATYLREWKPASVAVEWAGLRTLAPDGLPVIGEIPGNSGAYVAAGHGLLGITLAPATGDAIAKMIYGDDPPELRAFRVARSFH